MKKSKFSEAQIVFALKQSETVPVEEICRKMGISQALITTGRRSTVAWIPQNCAGSGSSRMRTAS